MKIYGQNVSAFGVSLGIHAVLLGALATIYYDVLQEEPRIVLETIFDQERVQEEFSQELEYDTEIAETLNIVAGGVVSTSVGAAQGPTISKAKIETSEALQEPELHVNAGDITMPGEELLGVDLGEGEITGEVGAVVEGYGAALSRMTQELLRLMREQPVHVVWLFDESQSMKDDQLEIQQKFHKIYEELGLAQKQDEKLRSRKEVLLTSIISFGEGMHDLTSEPTSDLETIRKAIEKIPIDESGLEQMCQSIAAIIDKYWRRDSRQDRRLVIVMISDESGDDGQYVEETLDKAKKFNVPIYILGRESVFGYPYARHRWKDPKYGLTHWLRINRGPETAFPEQLQWDGLHARWDVFSAGFGPYEQVRLSKETGGIFFLLPGEEEELVGAGAHEQRRFHFLDMKEYEPDLIPRRVYATERDRSEFRKTIWDVIARLNPNEYPGIPSHDSQLNIREHRYPLPVREFKEDAAAQVVKAARAMELLTTAIGMLEKIKPLREQEASQRWRANYDLILAQCIAFRVRLFQYLLAMDNHANNMPPLKKKNTTHWDVRRTPKVILPNEAQFERIKTAFKLKLTREEYLKHVKAEEDRATAMYEEVVQNHPGTPWAQRAQHELRHGYGMHFAEAFWDPNYDRPDLKLPKF